MSTFSTIECDGCGRSILTEDPYGMLAAIKGPCPTCRGTFRLALADDAPPQAAQPSRNLR